MLTIDEKIKKFLDLLKNYKGCPPTFEFDYQKEEISLIDCSSGFIKILLSNNGCTHLQNGKLSVSFFK